MQYRIRAFTDEAQVSANHSAGSFTSIPGLYDRIQTAGRQPDIVDSSLFRSLVDIESESLLSGASTDLPIDQRLLSLGDLFSESNLIDRGEKVYHVPIVGLHRPKVEGCKASLSIGQERSSEAAFTVKVAGLGGGRSGKYTFNRGTKVTADARCLWYLIPVRVHYEVFQRGENQTTKADVLEIGAGHSVREMDDFDDPCGRHDLLTELATTELNYLHGRVPGSFSETLEASSGSQFDASFSLGIEKLKTEVGLSLSVTAVQSIGFEYELAGEHNYTAYGLPDRLEWLWDWSNKQPKS